MKFPNITTIPLLKYSTVLIPQVTILLMVTIAFKVFYDGSLFNGLQVILDQLSIIYGGQLDDL